jgi:hypothetical protein
LSNKNQAGRVKRYADLYNRLGTTSNKAARAKIGAEMAGIEKNLREAGFDTTGKPLLPVHA